MTTSPTPPTTATRLASHVSIDTDDLARSVAFYRALFDAEPVLVKDDYARFFPAELGLVLGLNARSHAGGTGPLEHLGVLFPDAETLRAARERLARAGYATSGEEEIECCYARLAQFWASDPSGVRWELFLAHEEVVEAPSRSGKASACCAPSCCP